MPLLIQNITAQKLDHFQDDINFIVSFEGSIGTDDYVKLNRLEAMLQDFTRVSEDEAYETPSVFGLVINENKTFTELDISY